MTNIELEKYKNKLVALEAELEKDLAETPDVLNFEDRPSPEAEADEATSANEQVGIKTEIRSRIEDVRLALNRIGNGTYGVCQSCGGEIEAEILDIDPESSLCRECKLENKTEE